MVIQLTLLIPLLKKKEKKSSDILIRVMFKDLLFGYLTGLLIGWFYSKSIIVGISNTAVTFIFTKQWYGLKELFMFNNNNNNNLGFWYTNGSSDLVQTNEPSDCQQKKGKLPNSGLCRSG